MDTKMSNALCLDNIDGYFMMKENGGDLAICAFLSSNDGWNLRNPKIKRLKGLGDSSFDAITWDGGGLKRDCLMHDIRNFIAGYNASMRWFLAPV